MTRSLAACALVSLVALAVFAWGTDGFGALTSESARRLRVLRAPQPLPAVSLEGQDGRRFSLQQLQGRYVAVEFIYTRCESVCRSLGVAFRQLRDAAVRAGLEDQLTLVSVSFDPENDDARALQRYAATHAADGEMWRLARPAEPASLPALLEAFGVIVIPDGFGGFEHNAALHLVAPNGRLVRIEDLGAEQRFIDELKRVM